MMFKQEPGFGGRSALASVQMFDGTENTVNGGGRYFPKLFKQVKRQIPVFGLIEAHPVRKGRLEAFGADKIRGDPDFLKGFQDFGMVIEGFGSAFSERTFTAFV